MIIGVVGAGRLARMLAQAGLPLGLHFVFLDPTTKACATPLGEYWRGGYNDREYLMRLAERADVVTYELDDVPEEAIGFLSGRVPLFPDAVSLAISRDRLRQKIIFRELGIPTPSFVAVDSLVDLRQAVLQVGFPAVLKTRAPDSTKGPVILRQPEDIDPAWEQIGGGSLVLEGLMIPQREMSILGVSGRSGEMAFYPLAENTRQGGVLHLSRSRPGDPFQIQAEAYARRLLDHLDYVGVLALEFFQVGDNLFAHEMVPSAHDSGYWTIEGAETSHFENHLRAILGLPLGGTAAMGHAAMVSVIGRLPDPAQVLAVPGAHLHLYGKEPYPEHKLGHVTLRAQNEQNLNTNLQRMPTLGQGQEMAGTAF